MGTPQIQGATPASHEVVELQLQKLAKVAEDMSNWLKVHPADDMHKAAGLLFLYVVSQAQLPPPETAARIFAKSAEAVRLIVEEEFLLELERQAKSEATAEVTSDEDAAEA